MAKITAIGKPCNEFEREVLFYLRNNLPEGYEIFHNLELKQGKRNFEIDVIILAPHGVYIVDIKGTRGFIDIYKNRWCPSNSQGYPSPVAKLSSHAKILKSLIEDSNYANSNLSKVYVREAVILLPDGVQILDHVGHDEGSITYADHRCLKFFTNPDWGDRFSTDIRSYHGSIRRVITGKSQPQNPLPLLRDWQAEEKLGELGLYKEYRAHNKLVPAVKARLRVYEVDPYLDEQQRQQQKRLISNSYVSVFQLPSNSNILGIKEFFETQDNDCFVAVIDDLKGQSLSRYLDQDLSIEKKYNLIQEIIIALDFIHDNNVIHRNFTTANIFIDESGKPKLTGFDYARIQNRTTTIAYDPKVIEALAADACYHAPECYRNPGQATPQSDLFSAGVVFYEILTNKCPFTTPEEIYDSNAKFPQLVSELQPNLPAGFDQWLQNLCAFQPSDRPESADAALKTFAELITTPPIVEVKVPQTPDLLELKEGDTLKNRYEIRARLGQPGSFAVAYHVIDSWKNSQEQVLKLVYRDGRSRHRRLIQEYQILCNIPDHSHIVKCLSADEIPGEEPIPYIVFEYVKGESIEHWLERSDLTFQDIVTLARQVAQGLHHIHQHGVYHQDIKPSNLFWAEKGVKIIDFNIAAFQDETAPMSAGTRRYLPPDLSRTAELDKQDRIDRDLYALGITLYECLTQGDYPFDHDEPLRGIPPQDPRQCINCIDGLTDSFVQWLSKVLSPYKSDRFSDAQTFLDELNLSLQPQIETQPEDPVLEIIDPPPLEPQVSIPEPITKTISNFVGHPPYTFTFPQRLVLDPTKRYPIPPNCRKIATEVEWVQTYRSDDPLWIQGKHLCEWVEDYLQVWHRTDWIAEIKSPPSEMIKLFLEDEFIDPKWTTDQQFDLACFLQKYPKDQALFHVLAELTQTNVDFWLEPLTSSHLAHWLTIQVPEPWQNLEKAWLVRRDYSELDQYYQTPDKLNLLRQWIGLERSSDSSITANLGKYPNPIPLILQEEFDRYWYKHFSQELRNQPIYLDLSLESLPDPSRIATQIYAVLRSNSNLVTGEYLNTLNPYLTPNQRSDLKGYVPPCQPEQLSLSATPQAALTWATEQYLPFRAWEISHEIPSEQRRSEKLADSFVSWIEEHYPTLVSVPTRESVLNYQVTAQIEDMASEQSVLWVVVDGLGWLDHQQLLEYLVSGDKLKVESPLTACFSILPTLTGYAKWSLFSQKLPSDPSWEENAGRGFPSKPGFKRYTSAKTDQLCKDLRRKQYKVYCWDTTEFDDAYHKYSDWQSWYKRERLRLLEGIAKQIHGFLEEYGEDDPPTVVITSDHGQMLGCIPKMSHYPSGFTVRGRSLIGSVDHPEFLVLKADRFQLPHDISVVRKAIGLEAKTYNTEQEMLGSHGGLFPEEVVIGFSVLKTVVKRYCLEVKIFGKGTADQSGTFTLEVYNPNNLPLNQPKIQIHELGDYANGYVLRDPILPHQHLTLSLKLNTWPRFKGESKSLPLTGNLRGFLGGTEALVSPISQESALEIEQIFVSGLSEGALDDFL